MRGVWVLPLALLLAPVSASSLLWAAPHSGYNFQHGFPRWKFYNLPFAKDHANPGWVSDWEEVGELVGEAPPQRLLIDWPNNVQVVQPNTTTSVGWMRERPKLTWPADPGALYTVMLLDGGIQRVLPKVYLHWMVTNIPGNSVELGTEVMEYVTPFSLELKEDPLDGFIKDKYGSAHPMIFLVFKQPKRIQVEEAQRGCSPELVTARIHDYRDLVSKYDLELAAGNFIQCPWSGSHTMEMICRVTKCTREPFPFPIPGVNDLEECQGRKEVLDITVVGPRLSKWKEYAKYRSLFSLDSITSEIKNTYPEFSTGNVADFHAISGSYNNVPLGTENQDSTLEGVVDLTFLEYPSIAKTIELFALAALAQNTSLSHLFPGLVATGKPLKVIFSRPHDQDFDFMTVLKEPGMVADLNIVKVKPGREEDFQMLRRQIQAGTRSSRDIKSFTSFDPVRDLLDPSDPLYYDDSNNELWISTFESLEAKERFFGDIATDPMSQALITRFFDTFECIVCSVISAQHPSVYYPPFQ